MKNSYFDLINDNFYFPQEGFNLQDKHLIFNDISIKYLIKKYGTPFRLTYLPKVGSQIKKIKNLFAETIKKNNYQGNYKFCYCTKSNHFYNVITQALKHNVNIETSSSFDIDLIINLLKNKKIKKDIIIVHNGYKTDNYLDKIVKLQNLGFENSITVLDSRKELDRLLKRSGNRRVKIGLRMAVNEAPQEAYYTSRLGIKQNSIFDFFQNDIKDKNNIELKMLHFFLSSGIKDNMHYWCEFQKALNLYVKIKKESPDLDAFNLGGGFPIRNGLNFKYDYEYITNEIVTNIKNACTENSIPDPDIYTEFGKYTVGESGAIIFKVLEQKLQNESEKWYIIDNSLMNTIPDAWSIHEKFILLPVNKWENDYERVNIGSISCDGSDYYNSEDLNQEILLPKFDNADKEPLYLGFFHTGAYQDAISGYGGIKHCLIPSPKHIMIDIDENGNFIDYIYREEQTAEEMFKILGYK